MKLKNIPKEEIEQMSYTDLTYQLLKENKKAMTTPDIFKNICEFFLTQKYIGGRDFSLPPVIMWLLFLKLTIYSHSQNET